MLVKNKYLIFSIISAGVICIISAILLALFPAKKELILYWMQFICILLAFVCIIDCVRKDKTNLFLQLQVGAVLCFIFGLIYWVVHLTVLKCDCETFSISDISVIGFYLFLLSTSEILDREIQSNKGKKYIFFALIAPVMTIFCSIYQLIFLMKISPGNILYIVFYTAVFAPLAYFSFKFLIIPAKDNMHIKAMKPYVLVVFLILVINIIWNIINFIDHGILFLLCVFATSVLLLLLVPTAYGGYEKWKN